jgi:hypothetical protein
METVLRQLDRSALCEALADAESELSEAGSRLDLPGDVRLRLLNAAHRAQALVEATDAESETWAP